MALQLTVLPLELLQNILHFAGSEAKTLLNAEKSCRALRQIIAVDETWKFVPTVCSYPARRNNKTKWKSITVGIHNSNDFSGCASHRMRACICQAFRSIRKLTKQIHLSFHEYVLDLQGWSSFVQSAITSQSEIFGLGNLQDDSFILRSDTMGILAEIVQTTMISMLARANSVSCTIAEALGKYPILTRKNLRHELVFKLVNFRKNFVPSNNPSHQQFVAEVTELLPESTRTTIIHCFSRRAGIVRIASDAYDLIWGTFVSVTLSLLVPACGELIKRNELGNGKRLLVSGQSHYSVPPLTKYTLCADCGQAHDRIHTPVPQQIENAAKDLGLLHHKVYGFDNLAANETLETDIARDYEYEEEDSNSEDDEYESETTSLNDEEELAMSFAMRLSEEVN